MRPAFSLIIFTSLSGLGFGLAAVLGFGFGFGVLSASGPLWWFIDKGLAMGFVALVLIGVGVLSSLGHLGHPGRAWRALSQWRSSWLSREGVLAVVTSLVLMGFLVDVYVSAEPSRFLGFILGVLSLVTVWSTAMIYGSLRTVSRWFHPLTPFVFLGYSVAGGLVLGAGLDGFVSDGYSGGGLVLSWASVVALVMAGGVSVLWSRRAGVSDGGSTPESATGLGGLGSVRMLMSPHSEENWLQHEMGFRVARKHAVFLGRVGFILAIISPLLIMLGASERPVIVLLGSVLHVFGVMVLRWLFFAEAKHTVMLYYGERH